MAAVVTVDVDVAVDDAVEVPEDVDVDVAEDDAVEVREDVDVRVADEVAVVVNVRVPVAVRVLLADVVSLTVLVPLMVLVELGVGPPTDADAAGDIVADELRDGQAVAALLVTAGEPVSRCGVAVSAEAVTLAVQLREDDVVTWTLTKAGAVPVTF